MAFLAVLTAEGGVPIFTRSHGEGLSKLPFATLGTLNGVHLFSRLQEGDLKCVITSEEKIVWREYHKKILLILMTRNEDFNDCHCSALLDNVFAGMVMLLGLDLILRAEVLKLQKALSVCHGLVDYLLKQVDKDKANIGDLTGTTDCMLVVDTHALQDCLKHFLESADSLYGCLLVRGKVVHASKKWWTLTKQERCLVNSYLNCLPKVLSKEVIVYLPTSSPQNPNRLITLNLLKDIELCVLCSEEPPLAFLEEEAFKIWTPCFDRLKEVSSLFPRNFPTSIELDKNIKCLLLVHSETHQSVFSCLGSEAAEPSNLASNQEATRTLYKLVTGNHFKASQNHDPNLKPLNYNASFDYGQIEDDEFEACEYYICMESFKCYALQQHPYQLYVVYGTEIPTLALRATSYKTLKLLTERKLLPPF